MSKYLCALALSLCSLVATAQLSDSLYAVRKGPGFVLKYSLKAGESVSMIARRFFTTQEKIESLSMVDGRKKLAVGTDLYIPLVTNDNYRATREPVGMQNQQEVYYKVREKDDIALISLLDGIEKKDLIMWNALHGNKLTEGQSLFVGWVKIVPKDSINLANGLAYPNRKPRKPMVDTEKHAFGEADSLFNIQTRNGTNVISEKGTAVFFEKAGNNKIYYAFHSTSQPGTVIKVFNPGTGKTIYAKVLAPIPNTKLYSNAVIGICNAAKDVLGITDNKAWVELSYSPN